MAVILIVAGTATMNCGSGNNNNPNVTPFTGAPYTGVGTNGYTLNASGQCIMTSTGQIAPSSTYCTSSSYPYGTTGQYPYGTTGSYPYGTTGYGTSGYGMGTGGICYGPYIWNGQEGMCMGMPDNCRGYMLISAQTGQQVYCQ